MSNDAKLKRDIGLLAAGLLVLNGVVGAGIFGLPGRLADQAGNFSPWLIIIFGALIITVAWTYAELASYFTRTGGPVAYVSEAFGPVLGFQVGWMLYIGRVAALAANTNVLSDYLAYVWDAASGGLARVAIIFIFIGTLAAINIFGIKRAVQTVNILTFFKIIPILVLIILGFQYLTPEMLLPQDLPKIDDTEAVVLLVLYAFVGFEGALITAGETREPKKNLPRALISTVLIITALYFAVQLAYVAVSPPGGSEVPLVALGQELLGPIGGIIITITAVISIAGNTTVIIIAAPRMTFALAEDHTLPAWFKKVHEKYNTPANGIIFMAIFSALAAISGTFVMLAVSSTLARMVATGICILGLPRIRKKADQETLENAVKIPGGYLIPGIAMLVCIFAASQSSIKAWGYMAAFIAVGSVLYVVNKFYKTNQNDEGI